MDKLLTHPALRAFFWFSLGNLAGRNPEDLDMLGFPLWVHMLVTICGLLSSHAIEKEDRE
jgi:hypothetical protein